VRVVGRDGRVICERCLVADNAWLRLKGLLGRRTLPAGEGLLIRPTWSIHMFFMRFPIDAVFLDEYGVVVRIVPELRPWRAASQRGSKAVLELASGECERRDVRVGDRLTLEAA
jgi:uncharacterized membrane protein (UPF0127 family)